MIDFLNAMWNDGRVRRDCYWAGDSEPSTVREQSPGARSSTANGEYVRRLPVRSYGVGEKDTSRQGNLKALEPNPEVGHSAPMPKDSNRLVSWLRKLFT